MEFDVKFEIGRKFRAQTFEIEEEDEDDGLPEPDIHRLEITDEGILTIEFTQSLVNIDAERLVEQVSPMSVTFIPGELS